VPATTGTPAAGTAAQPQLPPELAAAEAAFRQGKVADALKSLQEAVKKDPDQSPAQVILARMFLQARMGGDMRGALEQAVIDNPDDPEPYMVLADMALADRRLTEAQLLYQKASDLMADFKKSAKRKEALQPGIHRGLAQTAMNRKDWAGAQKQLEAWLKLAPKSTDAMRLLASCLFEQKNVASALEELKAAAKLDPEKILTPEAVVARLYEQAGDHENAKKWMISALTVAPQDLRTRLVAGEWALQTGRLEDAQTQAAAALQIDPTSLGAKILRGVVALFQKDYTTAERYFELASLQSPKSFAASNDLALALVEQDDKTKQARALEYAENNVKNYQRTPDAPQAFSTYGWILYRRGNLDEAEKWLNAAASSGPVSPDTAYYCARLARDRNRDEVARQWLDNALKSPSPFACRPEAAALLAKLKK
jgi:tetratricopeptide (TPR) repeat protein